MNRETPSQRQVRLQEEFQNTKLQQQKEHEAGIRKIKDKEKKARDQRIQNQKPFEAAEVNSMNTRVIKPQLPETKPDGVDKMAKKTPSAVKKKAPAKKKPAAKKTAPKTETETETKVEIKEEEKK